MYAYAVISPSRLARCTARPSGCCRGARPPPAHLSRNTAAQQGQRQRPPALQRCQELRASSGREGSEAGGEEAEELPLGDWRAFRAKLVSTQQQQLQGEECGGRAAGFDATLLNMLMSVDYKLRHASLAALSDRTFCRRTLLIWCGPTKRAPFSRLTPFLRLPARN